MLVTHSEVMPDIFDPVTPGALRASIDCRLASSSATQDDMMKSLVVRRPSGPGHCEHSSCDLKRPIVLIMISEWSKPKGALELRILGVVTIYSGCGNSSNTVLDDLCVSVGVK